MSDIISISNSGLRPTSLFEPMATSSISMAAELVRVPNCEIMIFKHDSLSLNFIVGVYATRDIKKGEEIVVRRDDASGAAIARPRTPPAVDDSESEPSPASHNGSPSTASQGSAHMEAGSLKRTALESGLLCSPGY